MTERDEARWMTAPSVEIGSGDPLVLVPGGLTGWLSWEAHAERLARRHRVIRTQHLSVQAGLDDRPLPADYTLRTETRALARALDAREIREADVVGWSYGGAVALDLALEEPGRFRSLTVIEPAAYWILRGFDRFGPDAEAFAADMRAYGPDEVTEEQLARFVVGAGLVEEGGDPVATPRWPVWLAHRNSLRLADVPFRHQDDVGRLRRLDVPVLAFAGEGSPRYVRDVVDLLVRELPDARLEVLPGGHGLPHVSYDRFLELLEAFLETRGGPARATS